MLMCPQCGVIVEDHWPFCQACGYDPMGARPADWQPGAQAPVATAAVAAPTATATLSPQVTQTQPRPAAASASTDVPGATWSSIWEDPEPPPPPKAGIPRWVMIGGGAAVVILLLVVAAIVLRDSGSPTAGPPTTPVPKLVGATPDVVNWTPWQAPDGQFSISFPGANPNFQNTAVDPANGDGVLGGAAIEFDLTGAHYVVMYTDYNAAAQPGMGSPDWLRAKTLDGVHAVGDTMSDGNAGPFLGTQAWRYGLKNANGVASGKGVTFVAGSRVYLLITYTDHNGQYDFETFTNSFHLAG